MKRTHARNRSKKMAVAFGAVLVAAGCATATPQTTDTQIDRTSRHDNGVEQLLLYCGKLRDEGELSTAASICERAHNIDPIDPRPLIMLGNIFVEMERLPQAASAYLVVLEQSPHNVEARYLLGKTYIALGRHDLALQELQFALTQNPEDARIFNALGIANGLLGNRPASRKAFEEGLLVAPNDIPLRNNLGLALVLDGRHEEGIAMLQNVALDPAANATTIRNLQLAEGIAQSASANRMASDARPTESAALPGRAPQLASTAVPSPSFSADFDTETESVMLQEQPEVQIETLKPAATPSPSQTLPVPREPVTLTEALSPIADDTQMADDNPPVFLDSEPSIGEPEIFAVVAEKHINNGDGMDTSAEELGLSSMPQPVLTPENEQASDVMPTATGEMVEIVTANADTATPPATPLVTPLAASPSDLQTAALGGENIYSVQLASYRSADRAQIGWRQIRANALDLLQDVEPVIQRSDLGPEKGIYFRLRTKPYSKDTANQLCSALLSRGQSCLTIKENPSAPTAPAASAHSVTPEPPEPNSEATMPAAPKS